MRDLDDVLDVIEEWSQHKRIALLCGAGISRPSPSSIPTVPEIIDREFERLCREFPLFEDRIAESQAYYLGAPFEEFMSVARKGLLFRFDEILDEMKGGVPNAYHRFLARVLAKGPVSYLLTTNFDNLVEKALGRQLFDVNVTLDINDLPASVPALVKAHGSFWDPEGTDVRTTIGATIESITRGIHPEVIRSWTDLLNDYLLIVIGYGGRDRHDMLPILWRRNGPLVWISHEPNIDLRIDNNPIENDYLSNEARILLQDRPGRVCLRGNTESFLRSFGQIIGISFDEKYSWETNPALDFDSKARDSRLLLSPLYGKYAPLVTGFLFLNIGWVSEASVAFNEFIQNCTEDDYKLFAIACNGIGQALETMEAFDIAETAYKLALRGWLEAGDWCVVAQTENHMGIVARKMGDFETAFHWLDRARMRAEANDDQYSLGMTLHNLGIWYEKKGQHSRALESFRSSLAAKQLAGDYLSQPDSIDGIVHNSWLLNDLKHSAESVEWCIERLRLRWALGHDARSAVGLNARYEWSLRELVIALLEVYGDAATAWCQENVFLTESGLIDDLYTRGLPYPQNEGRVVMSGLGKNRSKALKILLHKAETTPPVTTLVYDCPYCGEGFISPLIGLPVEEVVGKSLPMNCLKCSRAFTLEVGRNVPTETL